MSYTTTTVDQLVKGDMIEVRTQGKTDIDVLTGVFVSVNSKGVNVKLDDGRTVTRALGKIVAVNRINTPADMFADDRIYTTAELAAALDMEAKVLRVQLRKLGLGVGKGTKYGFTSTQAREAVAQVRG